MYIYELSGQFFYVRTTFITFCVEKKKLYTSVLYAFLGPPSIGLVTMELLLLHTIPVPSPSVPASPKYQPSLIPPPNSNNTSDRRRFPYVSCLCLNAAIPPIVAHMLQVEDGGSNVWVYHRYVNGALCMVLKLCIHSY